MENDIIRVPEGYIQRVQIIAQDECSNCVDGNCLLLDDGYEPCVCPQRISRSLLCRYFILSVLPAHKDLYFKLCGHGTQKHCAICGKPFYPTGRSARFCAACRAKRDTDAARMRKRRQRGSMSRFLD